MIKNVVSEYINGRMDVCTKETFLIIICMDKEYLNLRKVERLELNGIWGK